MHLFRIVADSLRKRRDAVKFLVDPTRAAEADASATAVAPVASKGIKAAAKAFEAVVGMDEPPSEMS